jgi:hypothetical protein
MRYIDPKVFPAAFYWSCNVFHVAILTTLSGTCSRSQNWTWDAGKSFYQLWF